MRLLIVLDTNKCRQNSHLSPSRQSSSTSPTKVPTEPSISTIAFEHRMAAIESTISRISKDTKTVCVAIDDNNSRESTKGEKCLLDDSEELLELAAEIVQRATSMASSAASTAVHGPSNRVWESASIDGVPLSRQRRENILHWSKDVGSKDSSSKVNHPQRRARAVDNTQHTPELKHAKVKGENAFDIEEELVEQRYQLARTFYVNRDFEKAITLLRKSVISLPKTDLKRLRAQLRLAKSFLQVDCKSKEALSILQELAPHDHYTKNDEVLHYLAQVQLQLDPSKAKDTCLLAIKQRSRRFGRAHRWTVGSIGLMIQICQATGDADADVWNNMLQSMRRKDSGKSQGFRKGLARATLPEGFNPLKPDDTESSASDDPESGAFETPPPIPECGTT
jgi:tetratricopeptide (TPR) repeat protein